MTKNIVRQPAKNASTQEADHNDITSLSLNVKKYALTIWLIGYFHIQIHFIRLIL